MKTALITGIGGQDGSYLAEMLQAQGYHVVGLSRIDGGRLDNIQHLQDRVTVEQCDLDDQDGLEALLKRHAPAEIYNLAADSFMPAYAQAPLQATTICALGAMRLLEAVRKVNPQARFFQASSSEMFGHAVERPQSERTPFAPHNLYAIAKVFAHRTTGYYREHYRLFACCGILFNHESPRRNPAFVTRRITMTAAQIKLGLVRDLPLGDLETRRDWGFAGDYTRAMWLMLQQPTPDDFVIATGETHSVREFCELAFTHLGLNYEKYVVHDPSRMRSSDYQPVGNPEKARTVLGWKPSVSFSELVGMMVEADLKALRDGAP